MPWVNRRNMHDMDRGRMEAGHVALSESATISKDDLYVKMRNAITEGIVRNRNKYGIGEFDFKIDMNYWKRLNRIRVWLEEGPPGAAFPGMHQKQERADLMSKLKSSIQQGLSTDPIANGYDCRMTTEWNDLFIDIDFKFDVRAPGSPEVMNESGAAIDFSKTFDFYDVKELKGMSSKVRKLQDCLSRFSNSIGRSAWLQGQHEYDMAEKLGNGKIAEIQGEFSSYSLQVANICEDLAKSIRNSKSFMSPIKVNFLNENSKEAKPPKGSGGEKVKILTQADMDEQERKRQRMWSRTEFVGGN